MNKKRFHFWVSTALIISLLSTGCGTRMNSLNSNDVAMPVPITVEVENNEVKNQREDEQKELENETMCPVVNRYSKKERDNKYLPQIEEVVAYSYYYLCYSMEYSQIQQYKNDLLALGLKKNSQEISDITYESYVDDQKRIVVIEAEDCLIVSVADVFDGMETEENAFSKESIYEFIHREYNNQLEVTDSMLIEDYPPEIMIKCWIPELYEKTNIQAYQTFTRNGKNAGIYLVIDDGACRIQGELDNICIADLDQNGISELLTLYGYGSGIYRIHLNAYQYSTPIYFNSLNKMLHCSYSNCFIPKNGYADLTFKKISDTEVHLVEMKCEYVEDERGSREQITYGADFGNLVVIKNELYIAVENMSDFPYYEWDKYFEKTPDSIDSNSEKKQFSEEVPELTVTINDTTLKNFSWKDNWGTITEDPISFSELMADKTKIPTFSCPKLFEYDEEIGLSFLDGIKPESIELQDYLITEDGTTMYGESGVVKREIRYGDDGNYYVGLMGHPALYLSSNMSAYTNPSYRGFRVLCQFDDQHTCEYVFVLSIDPVNWEK